MLFTAFLGSSSTTGTSDYIQDLDKTGQCKIGENRKAFTLQKLAGLVLHVQKLGEGFLWIGGHSLLFRYLYLCTNTFTIVTNHTPVE